MIVSAPGLKAKAEEFLSNLPPAEKGDPGVVLKAEDLAKSLTLKGAKDTKSIFVFENPDGKEIKIKLKPSFLVSSRILGGFQKYSYYFIKRHLLGGKLKF